MKDKCFVDTNIFVYSFDDSSPKKQKISKNIIKSALSNRDGIISYQVIQEFINLSTKKFKNSILPKDLALYLNDILDPLCEVHSSTQIFQRALIIIERYKLSYYDALIIASAIEGGCNLLLTEDLQHNQKIFNIKIVNPFIK